MGGVGALKGWWAPDSQGQAAGSAPEKAERWQETWAVGCGQQGWGQVTARLEETLAFG